MSESDGVSWAKSGQIPCLDGLRAFSILFVMFSHWARTVNLPYPFPQIARRGGMGVDVFFVISGFLITLLLFREQDRAGRISLSAFYLRRSLRILPGYFAYLAFVFVLWRLGYITVRARDWIPPLTYTTNFFNGLPWMFRHTWSLSVEEHFYLLWPLALILLGRGRAFYLLSVIILSAPIIRFLAFRLGGDYTLGMTPCVMDSIALGCVLAYIATERLLLIERLRTSGPWIFWAAVGVAAASSWACSWSWKYDLLFGRTIGSSAIAVAVLAAVSSSDSILGRILESRMMVFIGVLSYSLYLWQQPFFNHHDGLWGSRWPQNVFLTVTAALASHYLVERPFLRIKDRVGNERWTSALTQMVRVSQSPPPIELRAGKDR